MTERRIDPEDGAACPGDVSWYTWEEFSSFYTAKYKKKAIEAYWEECEVKKGQPCRKPKAAAKAKAKAKVKAKAKAKAESKARPFEAANPGQKIGARLQELCVFDLSVAMVPPAGVAADLGHLERSEIGAARLRKSDVKGYVMEVGQKPIDNLEECLGEAWPSPCSKLIGGQWAPGIP
eukprot:Skav208524  [mRNA]  locus=scaffold1322:253557:257563:- [translate_table: standard]